MDIPTLSRQLTENHAAFFRMIRELSDADFLAAPHQKWTAGQQLEHIRRSVTPVNLAFGLPGYVLRFLFGTSNRPSRTYEALIERYHQKLAAGGKASGRFVPPPFALKDREKAIARLEAQVKALTRRLSRYPESKLDTLLLPHPLLGKLTLREMLYFTAYHVTHHHKAVQQNLQIPA